MRQQTQKDQILNHLQSGKSLTPQDALKLYGSFRLAAVVHTLKGEGHNIVTDLITKNDATFASYSIKEIDLNNVYVSVLENDIPKSLKKVFLTIDKMIDFTNKKVNEVSIKNSDLKQLKDKLKTESLLVYRGIRLKGV